MTAIYNFRPTVLLILDGWGVAPPGAGNAVELASLPNFRRLRDEYPSGQLFASGEEVGIPRNEPGNSEVGHLNIGAGRIVYQDITRINIAIENGSFYKNPAFLGLVERQKKYGSAIHLIGLVGKGTVHSSLEHLKALLSFLEIRNCGDVFLHLFTDGRDSPPNSALEYISQVEDFLKNHHVGRIASIGGRYFGMDRDRRWERIRKAYLAINGRSEHLFTKAEEAVLDSYKKGIFDEFIEPSIITDKEGETVRINKEDQLLFFNFRADRVRQIVSALVDPDFKGFERVDFSDNRSVVTMVNYEQGLPVQVAFERVNVENTLSQVISEHYLTQLHLAETEKYAHVTYFFNGGREESFAGEKRILVPSPKVETYDQKPEMSAREITETLLTNLKEKDYDFVVVNFANPDMVGHSAKIPETVKALEVVDECLGKIEKEVNALSGALVITADHGKAEQLLDPDTGKPDTAHSTNPVPVIIVQKSLAGYSNNKLNKGLLSDVAPTVLKLMGLGQPKEMMGKSLI